MKFELPEMNKISFQTENIALLNPEEDIIIDVSGEEL